LLLASWQQALQQVLLLALVLLLVLLLRELVLVPLGRHL
jgi:hypothetical protein